MSEHALAGRARPPQTHKLHNMRYVIGRVLILTLTYALLLAGSTIFLFPVFWMVTTSVKPTEDVIKWPPVWIPNPAVLRYYPEAWARSPFVLYYWNTIKILVIDIIGTVSSSTLVAYSFGRLRFRGRDFLFLMLLSTMMLPGQVRLIPLFIWYSKLNWVGTILPLVVPSFFGGAFNVFLLRQYVMTIPLELDDAAKIDGCGYFEILWRIIVPLMKPVIGVVTIFTFTNAWNDFMGPLLYLPQADQLTLAIGLRMFYIKTDVEMPHVMAMTTVALLPLILVFFFAQRQMVQGITLTGIKA